MSTEPIKPFNLEAVYDAEISPLMAKIIEICKREGMPMFASFNYAKGDGDEHETHFCTTHLSRKEDGKDKFLSQFNDCSRAVRTTGPAVAFTITLSK